MSRIDPTARVEDGAVIGDDVTIGPYCVVGPHVTIGAGTKLVSHVNISARTKIGENCTIYPFVSLGTPPQSVHYHGEPTRLTIGATCQIRENVTINTGTVAGGGITTVGDNCFLMAGSHVAHDCRVGNSVIFANNAVIGGHSEIGDHVFLGGQAAVLQRVRVGESAMLAGFTGVREDVIPFGFAMYPYARLTGLNVIGGLRHGGASLELEATLHDASRIGVGRALDARLRGGGQLHGFGHPLYPDGDPRARALLRRLDELAAPADRRAVVDEVLDAAGRRSQVGEPNVDAALAAVSFLAGMRPGAGEAIFALARTAGWIAHALEQYDRPTFVRGRVDYVGPRPER